MTDYADFGPTVDNRGVAGHEFSDHERALQIERGKLEKADAENDRLQSQVDALRKRLHEVLNAPHSNTSDKDPTGVMVLLDAYWLAAVARETSDATGGGE